MYYKLINLLTSNSAKMGRTKYARRCPVSVKESSIEAPLEAAPYLEQYIVEVTFSNSAYIDHKAEDIERDYIIEKIKRNIVHNLYSDVRNDLIELQQLFMEVGRNIAMEDYDLYKQMLDKLNDMYKKMDINV